MVINVIIIVSFVVLIALLNRSTQELSNEIISHSSKYNSIEFIGREFTVRKDAILLVYLAKMNGFEIISIETNGRMFAISNFTNTIIKAGLNKITFSIHRACAETHDKITRTENSFEQCIDGLENVNKYNIDICINFVITKYNYKEMPKFISEIDEFRNVKTIFFSFVRPMDYLRNNILKNIVPTYTEILPFLKLVEKDERVKFQYIPRCVFNSKKIVNQNHKKYIDKNYGLFGENSNLFSSLINEFIKDTFCKDCFEDKNCIGILKNYCSLFSKKEFKSIINRNTRKDK